MIDLAAVAILFFLFILGLVEGVKRNFIRFATVMAGIVLAKVLSPSFSQSLQDTIMSLKENDNSIFIAFFIIFALVFFVGESGARLLEFSLKKKKLTRAHRFFGGTLGLMTGAVVVLLLFFFVQTVVPKEETEFWNRLKTTRTAQYSAWALEKGTCMLPRELDEDDSPFGEVGDSSIQYRKGPLAQHPKEPPDTPAMEEPPPASATEEPPPPPIAD